MILVYGVYLCERCTDRMARFRIENPSPRPWARTDLAFFPPQLLPLGQRIRNDRRVVSPNARFTC